MVTFICTGNWYRSRFAAAYARHRGLNAISRGIEVYRVFDERLKHPDKISLKPVCELNHCMMAQESYDYLKQLGVSDEVIAKEPYARQLDLTTDVYRSSVVIALYEQEHYPMLWKHHQYREIASKIMYWDIKDLPPKVLDSPEELLESKSANVSLGEIKRLIDSMFMV
jgi:hypothetical protein